MSHSTTLYVQVDSHSQSASTFCHIASYNSSFNSNNGDSAQKLACTAMSTRTHPALPSSSILTSFHLPTTPPPLPLAGGQSTSFKTSSCSHILKYNPSNSNPIELAAVPQILSSLPTSPHFRIPNQIISRPNDGASYIVDGWSCTTFVPGKTLPADGPVGPDIWRQVLDAGQAFHLAMGHTVREKPTWVDGRSHRWAKAEGVAWGEQPSTIITVPKEAATIIHKLQLLMDRLDQLSVVTTENVEARIFLEDSQLVHGDLAGNVLVHAELPPAIIDFSPYWRPVAWTEAVLVSDGMVEFGSGKELLELWVERRFMGERWIVKAMLVMLLRAMVFRALSDWMGEEEDGITIDGWRWDRAMGIVSQAVRHFLDAR